MNCANNHSVLCFHLLGVYTEISGLWMAFSAFSLLASVRYTRKITPSLWLRREIPLICRTLFVPFCFFLLKQKCLAYGTNVLPKKRLCHSKETKFL